MSRAQPNIVLACLPDLVGPATLDRLDEIGKVLNREPVQSWTDPRCTELLAVADIILGHWGCPRLDGDMLTRTPSLGLFAYGAGTVKQQVSDALWERDVRVTSGANANAEPVAEFTLAAILFANKRVLWRLDPDQADTAAHGSPGNYDKTIGIVGASLVGRRVIDLLAAFPHLRTTLYDPFVSADEAEALGAAKLDLDELCATCDILSIHAPALASTRHLIGAAQLAALADGAVVINTARGSLLDHNALLQEATTGRLSAILDVTEPEPLPPESALRALPNVTVTPHISGSQGTELLRMDDYLVEEIRRWANGEPALNEITADRLGRLA